MPHKFCYQNNLQLLLLLMRPQFGWHGTQFPCHRRVARCITQLQLPPHHTENPKLGKAGEQNRGAPTHVSFPINLLGQSIAGVGQT